MDDLLKGFPEILGNLMEEQKKKVNELASELPKSQMTDELKGLINTINGVGNNVTLDGMSKLSNEILARARKVEENASKHNDNK